MPCDPSSGPEPCRSGIFQPPRVYTGIDVNLLCRARAPETRHHLLVDLFRVAMDAENGTVEI